MVYKKRNPKIIVFIHAVLYGITQKKKESKYCSWLTRSLQIQWKHRRCLWRRTRPPAAHQLTWSVAKRDGIDVLWLVTCDSWGQFHPWFHSNRKNRWKCCKPQDLDRVVLSGDGEKIIMLFSGIGLYLFYHSNLLKIKVIKCPPLHLGFQFLLCGWNCKKYGK